MATQTAASRNNVAKEAIAKFNTGIKDNNIEVK